MGDPRHMDGGGDVSSDAAFDGVVVSAAELTECNESRLSGGEVLEHLSLDFDALAFVDERDTRMAALEEQVRALQVAACAACSLQERPQAHCRTLHQLAWMAHFATRHPRASLMRFQAGADALG